MSRVHYAISRKLAAEVEGRKQWDEPPALYRLHVRNGQPNVIPVAVPLSLWGVDRPPAVLDLIAELMGDRRFRFNTEDEQAGPLYGMAFRHEGWLVEGPWDNSAAARSTQVMAGDHKLYLHPGRVEVRMLYAVDRAQITYSATVRRTSPPTAAERLIAYPDGRGEGWGELIEQALAGSGGTVQPAGSVVEALDAMVEHLLGVPALKRPSSHVASPSWS